MAFIFCFFAFYEVLFGCFIPLFFPQSARLPHPEGWRTGQGSGFAMTLIFLFYFRFYERKLLTAPLVEESDTKRAEVAVKVAT